MDIYYEPNSIAESPQSASAHNARRQCSPVLGRSLTGLPLHDRYLIQQHPEVEAKLVAELDKAGLLLTPQRLAPRAMEYADLAHLTYLSWVCKAGSLPVYILYLYSTFHILYLILGPSPL